MNCIYLRSKFSNICEIFSVPEKTHCQGNQGLCRFPMELAKLEAEPEVVEDNIDRRHESSNQTWPWGSSDGLD